MIEALMKEAVLQQHFFTGQKIETIYFGGGTPSLLTANEIQQITEHLIHVFQINTLKECTIEANPDDLSKTYLKGLKHTTVNRFSIGVQSFQEADLRFMNRAHNAGEADYAIKAAQDAGFTNLSVDLIYGTPGLTDALWMSNLDRIDVLDIPHLSCYALTVEEGTPLHHFIKKEKTPPLNEEQAARQMQQLMSVSEAFGYEHYEISNFAKPGCYAVHNTNYWKGTPYLGLGPSAHSFSGQQRCWNVSNNMKYLDSILKENTIPKECENLTPVQQINEYIMTSIRTMWGINVEKVQREWGSLAVQHLLEQSSDFIKKEEMKMKDGCLVLTSRGKHFADGIAAELFQSEV